jgi:NAD-dependent dihydropyrimidine dehydrogenase PreA subunit
MVEERVMAYVITEPCIDVKDTSCVEVCPVDAIHPRKDERNRIASRQLFINPNECTCCGACVLECPVNAIFDEDDVPEQWREYIIRNAEAFED